jgi:hypothetical protein
MANFIVISYKPSWMIIVEIISWPPTHLSKKEHEVRKKQLRKPQEKYDM